MTADSEYFIARGRSAELIEAHFAALNAHRTAFWALGQEFGATAPVWRGREGYGWEFADGCTSDALREDSKHPGIWHSNVKTKAGRALRDRVRDLPKCPHGLVWDFWPRQFFGGIPTGDYVRGGQPHSGVGVEKLGDDWVIDVPIPWRQERAPVPPDAVPLARSEYWRRREAQDAAQEQAVQCEPSP